MIPRNSLEEGVPVLKLEAIDWAARLGFGGVSDDERREFEAWRHKSPAHEDAYRNATAFIGHLNGLGIDADELPPHHGKAAFPKPEHKPALSRRAFIGGGAIAASVAAGAVVAQSPLGLWPTLSELMADERTLAGERRTISPMAGVAVEMNSRSSVSMIARGVRLVSGEVFVAMEGREGSFTVDAGSGIASTSQGRFDIRNYDGELCITCIDGDVTSSIDGRHIRLAGGEAVTYRSDGSMDRAHVDVTHVTAWRRGLLIFDQTPLPAAIAEINRYYPGRLVLRGGDHSRRLMTGIFHVNQIENAVLQIRNLQGVTTTRLPGGVVLIA